MFSLGKKKKQTEEKIDRVLKNPKILEVNLVRDEIGISFDWKKNAKGLVIALVVTGLIIFEFYAGLDWWQQDEELRLEDLKAKISAQVKETNDFRKTADVALSYKIKTVEVGNLLDNHVYWTNFFSWLEKNTLSTISYDSFNGKADGKYFLSGTAGSFADVSWQVKTLLDDPMTVAATVDLVNSGDGKTKEQLEAEMLEAKTIKVDPLADVVEASAPQTSFSLSLEVSPDIFKKQ